MAGKGDKARNNDSQQFRDNYDRIFGEKKTPAEWQEETEITVYDPDGWRRNCLLGQKSFDVPITKKEFLRRCSESTVMNVIKLSEELK
tara:strand:+ start:45682 stop:45945 length:264 start_codon:yes stop_codon:yes gene_type:complete